MVYIWEAGKKNRVMHIAGFDPVTGKAILKAQCGIDLRFNRGINAPFTLGRKVCSKCEKKASLR